MQTRTKMQQKEQKNLQFIKKLKIEIFRQNGQKGWRVKLKVVFVGTWRAVSEKNMTRNSH